MSGTVETTKVKPFTVEQFYKFLKEKKLMAAKCGKCGSTYLPPRPICTNCFSKELSWVELEPEGKLVTYTVIHIAPQQFQDIVPYAYGIVELQDRLRLSGIIKEIERDKLKIGIELTIDVDTEPSQEWPRWLRYYFKPP